MQLGWDPSPPSISPPREGGKPGARGPWCQHRAGVTAAPCEKGTGFGYKQRIPFLPLLALTMEGHFFDTHAHFTEKSSPPFSLLFVSLPSVISNLPFSSRNSGVVSLGHEGCADALPSRAPSQGQSHRITGLSGFRVLLIILTLPR